MNLFSCFLLVALTTISYGQYPEPSAKERAESEAMYLRDNPPACKPAAPCTIASFPTGDHPTSAMVDNERKILMEFSPKADSSNALGMFLDNMGYHFGKNYHQYSHLFHRDFIIPRCGTQTVCMYYDPQWFRFKVVRNPYLRAVSSYLHCLHSKLLSPEIAKDHNYNLESLSFYSFLSWVKTLKRDYYGGYCDGHFKMQTSKYERSLLENNISPFHEIVPIENSKPALDRINKKLGSNFELLHTDYAKTWGALHDTPKDRSMKKFVGKTAYHEIKDSVPASYEFFYDSDIFQLVSEIYSADILAYNYSYPFNNIENTAVKLQL